MQPAKTQVHIVCIDGSQHARRALDWSIERLSWRADPQLIILCVNVASLDTVGWLRGYEMLSKLPKDRAHLHLVKVVGDYTPSDAVFAAVASQLKALGVHLHAALPGGSVHIDSKPELLEKKDVPLVAEDTGADAAPVELLVSGDVDAAVGAVASAEAKGDRPLLDALKESAAMPKSTTDWTKRISISSTDVQVVCGARGVSTARRLVLGSTSQRLVHEFARVCPVTVVRCDASERSSPEWLVLADHTPASERALDWAASRIRPGESVVVCSQLRLLVPGRVEHGRHCVVSRDNLNEMYADEPAPSDMSPTSPDYHIHEAAVKLSLQLKRFREQLKQHLGSDVAAEVSVRGQVCSIVSHEGDLGDNLLEDIERVGAPNVVVGTHHNHHKTLRTVMGVLKTVYYFHSGHIKDYLLHHTDKNIVSVP